ncbi:50S ribosomal protein L11 methyltransferase [Limnofasciculus baicalensis]
MSWMELSIDATHEAVDWVSTLLAAIHYTGDMRITNYIEPELNQLDNCDILQSQWAFTIYLYLPYNTNVRRRVEEIVDRLSPLHRTGLIAVIQTAIVEDKPEETANSIPPIHRIGKRFVVLTPDNSYQSEDLDEITLKINTTLAFGSGLHPATILSLLLLERYIIPPMNVLDLGCGSGILSVAMAKLGASVLALDNDNIAVDSTQDAIRINGVEKQVTVKKGSLGSGSDLGHWLGGNTINNVQRINASATFDLIVANIFARIHIALADDFCRAIRRTREGTGILITAGFTTDYEDEVSGALVEAGFEAIDCERLNEWVALAYRLKG